MCSEKNLIVSFDSYSWIEYCTGLILNSTGSFEVIIVCKDDKRQIYNCKDLCSNAIYEQRASDLYLVGTNLEIKKMSNLLLDEDNLDVAKLTMQLQLLILLNSFKDIYYQSNDCLNIIFNNITDKCNSNIYRYKYTPASYYKIQLCVQLKKEILDKKQDMLNLIVGGTEPKYIAEDLEIFHQIN